MDGLLAYMYTMIEECRAQGKDLNRDFSWCAAARPSSCSPACGSGFAGSTPSVRAGRDHRALCHVLRSAGDHRGQRHAHEFKENLRLRVLLRPDGAACWPKLDVNFTNKTQFVYRINKGVLDVSDDKKLNDSMPDDTQAGPLYQHDLCGRRPLRRALCMKMMRAYGGRPSPCTSPATGPAWRSCWQGTDGWTLCPRSATTIMSPQTICWAGRWHRTAVC